MVPLKIVFNVSRFKPAFNWNRFLADLRFRLCKTNCFVTSSKVLLQCRLPIPQFSGSHCNIINLTVKSMNLIILKFSFLVAFAPKRIIKFPFLEFPHFPLPPFFIDVCVSISIFTCSLWENEQSQWEFIHLSIYLFIEVSYSLYIYIFIILIFYVWHLFKFRFFPFVHENSTLTEGLDFRLYIY